MADTVDAVANAHFQKLRDHKWVWEDWKNFRSVWTLWRKHRRSRYWPNLKQRYLDAAYHPGYEKLDLWVLRVFSPTRAFADRLKHMLPAAEAHKHGIAPASLADKKLAVQWKGRVLRAMNFGYRLASLAVFIFLVLFGGCLPWPFLLPFAWYGFSRANEVIYAFGRDALRIAKGETSTSDLRHDERIKLALWSYVSLLVDFAIVYYVFRCGFDLKEGSDGILFNPVSSIWSALYFSGVTMATLGYGDVTPGSFVLRALVLYQVACGIALLVLSFALYVGSEPKPGSMKSRRRGAAGRSKRGSAL